MELNKATKIGDANARREGKERPDKVTERVPLADVTLSNSAAAHAPVHDHQNQMISNSIEKYDIHEANASKSAESNENAQLSNGKAPSKRKNPSVSATTHASIEVTNKDPSIGSNPPIEENAQKSLKKKVYQGLCKAVKFGDFLTKPDVENLQDKYGGTFLHFSAEYGHKEVANALVEAGADVNMQDEGGETALHCAAGNGKLEVVKLLVEAGADVNFPNKDGETALHCAAGNGKLEVVKLLVEAGADVNFPNKDRETALHCAAGNGKLEVVKLLVEAGADVNFPNKDGETALHCAAENNGLLVVYSLLKVPELDVERQNMCGDTALHRAGKNGHLEVVDALVKAGADVNMQNWEKYTALHLGAEYGHRGVVRALLQAKSDVAKQNMDGKTALDLAQSKKRKAIANLITSAAAGSTSLPKKKKRERSKKEKADATGALPAESAADAKNDQALACTQEGAAEGEEPTLADFFAAAGAPSTSTDVAAAAAAGASSTSTDVAAAAGASSTSTDVAAATAAAGAPSTSTDVAAAVAGAPSTSTDVAAAVAGAPSTSTDVAAAAASSALPAEISAGAKDDQALAPENAAQRRHSSGDEAGAAGDADPSLADIPFLETAAIVSAAPDTIAEVDALQLVLLQGKGVKGRKEWMQKMDALKAKYNTAKAAADDKAVGEAASALRDHEYKSKKLKLSICDFETLPKRCEIVLEDLEKIGNFTAVDSVLKVLALFKNGSPSVPSKGDKGPQPTAAPSFKCGDTPIDVTEKLGVSCARAMLRGHFSNIITDSVRNSKTVTKMLCVIKCAVLVEGSAKPLEASVAALRSEYSIYELIREKAAASPNGTTGCVDCYSAHPSYHYLVLEDYGQDLTHLLNPQLENGQQVVRAIVEAVQALHSLSVVHGDIKPQNLLFRYTMIGKCEVKVCDLDCAYQVGEECVASTLGTKYFHAPEVYRAATQGSSTKVKAALEMDLFALGLVLWQVLQRSPQPALSHASESQLDRCYADQATLWEHLPIPERGQWYQSHLESLTALEPHKRKSATSLLQKVRMFDASNAQNAWLEEHLRNEHLQHSVVDGVAQLMHGQENLSDKVDLANAKLDRVLEVLQSKFDGLGQEVVGVAATLRKEMLLGREHGQVLEGMVQATQDTLYQLSVKAPGDSSCVEGCINGDQIVSLLSTLQSRIEESVTTAVSQQQQQQPSSPSQAALTEMSGQFKVQFSTLSADLQVFMEDQRSTLQDQQRQAQQMQQCLTSSLQDVFSNLSAIKQEVAQLKQGQEQLGRQVAEVLTHNKELAAMVNTLITGTHSIPTLAIILPVVSNSWRSLLSPMRLVRNRFRLFFLCSHTHRISPCGPNGEGYEITVTKQWVQDAAPVLRVGLVLVKLALLSAGLPLPVPDLPALLNASGLHAKYLDAALHLVQNPADDKGGAEFDMDKAVDKLVSWEERHLLQEQGMGEGGMALQEGSRKAYETIQEVLKKDGVNIALTSGLRQVTHGGKTAWILDNNDVEAQFKSGTQQIPGEGGFQIVVNPEPPVSVPRNSACCCTIS